jgi:methanol--5-hydroxybenzimidazolylcobamide Co-methyltransferase
MGNIAGAVCDLWSNESVQNVRLLAGNAPEVFTESLAYDCRLMNVAAARGSAKQLRDWLVESDEWLSPQAAILSPAAAIEIASAIVGASGGYRRVLAAGAAAVRILRSPSAGRLRLSDREKRWLDRIESEFLSVPAEDELLEEIAGRYSDVFDCSSYGLPAPDFASSTSDRHCA